MKKSLQFIAIGVWILATLSFYQCASEKEAPNDTKIVTGLSVATLPDSLNPLLTRNQAAQNAINGFIHLTLTASDPQTGQQSPLLLQALPPINARERSWELEILPQARWKDGTPITFEDVAFSFKLASCPGITDLFVPHTRFLEGVTVNELDAKKGIIRFYECGLYNAYLLAEVPILQRATLDPDRIWDAIAWPEVRKITHLLPKPEVSTLSKEAMWYMTNWRFYANKGTQTALSGSGPYEISTWDNSSINLTPVPDYWGKDLASERPYLSQNAATLSFLPLAKETQIQLMNFSSGELDIAVSNSGGIQVDSVEAPQINKSIDLRRWVGIFWNVNPAPTHSNRILKDARVRKALNVWMPRQQIMDEVFPHGTELAYSPVKPTLPEYLPSLLESQDLGDSADIWLEEAGWIDYNGDGMREKKLIDTYEPLSLTLWCGSQNVVRIGEIIQDALRPHGIAIKLESKKGSARVIQYLEESDGRYDGAILAPGYTDPYDYQAFFHTEGAQNYSRFGSPYTDSLIVAVNQACSPESHQELSQQMQAILYQEVPISVLFSMTSTLMVRKEVCADCLYPYPPYIFPNQLPQ